MQGVVTQVMEKWSAKTSHVAIMFELTQRLAISIPRLEGGSINCS